MKVKQIRSDFPSFVQKTAGLKAVLSIFAAAAWYFWVRMNGSVSLQLFYLFFPLILFVLIFRLSRRLLPDWPKTRDLDGIIELTKNSIETAKESIDLRTCDSLEIVHHNYKGKTTARATNIDNGVVKILLAQVGKSLKVFQFQLQNNEELKDFQQILRSWYGSGINITEHYTVHRIKTLILEKVGNKSYQELKNIKKQLEIK